MNSVASVKAKLKNLSKETGKNMLEMLTMYGLERTSTVFRFPASKRTSRSRAAFPCMRSITETTPE